MDDHSTPGPGPAPDLFGVLLPAGGRALMVSDLHLSSAATPASRAAAEELAGRLAAWDGPGVVVLNFAAMRAVLAGKTGDGLAQRLERWVFRRLSDDLQIESLWPYNAKYDPDWRPRYALYQRRGDLLAASLAVARAEGITEIPVLGRCLSPPPAAAAAVPPAAVPMGAPVEALS